MNPDLAEQSALPPTPSTPSGAPAGTGGEQSSTWDLPPEVIPNIDDLITDDGAPVDSIFVEMQQRLLTEALYSSWAGPGGGRPFLALANVGLFSLMKQPPLVPDVMLSLDVRVEDPLVKENRSYFLWIIGKAPEVVIEIVSDRRGGEDSYKMREYARIGVLYYVIFDPEEHLGHGVLRAFQLQVGSYEPMRPAWLPVVGLGLTMWEGKYANTPANWLRWCDQQGRVIPTGAERAEEATRQAERERQRLERLLAQLRAQGVELPPEQP